MQTVSGLHHSRNFIYFDFFERLRRLVVEHDEISITHVEAGKMLTGVLGIEDVLIDDESRTSSFCGVSPARKIPSFMEPPKAADYAETQV